MLKPLNFGQYQALKRYSFNQMNSWAVSVYKLRVVNKMKLFKCWNLIKIL